MLINVGQSAFSPLVSDIEHIGRHEWDALVSDNDFFHSHGWITPWARETFLLCTAMRDC
ncbi:hypothetical protein [Xenorhabdus bovienii]|uniref:hypothetical protein n=1 Tax=Xenorhabdus bovienii TaxID=40576 RepID=UPI0023B2EE5E|nr:hypothetical protein [Xenorhabdus bovienii]